MKIGYVVDTFPKLSEAFILNEITELRKRGIEVVVFSLNRPSEKVSHTEYDKSLAGKVYYPPSDRLFPCNILFIPNFVTLLGSTFVERPGTKIQNILKARYFTKIARKEGVDLLHAHFAASGAAAAMYISQALNVPFIVTTHAFSIFSKPNRSRASRILKSASHIITISDHNKNHINKVFGVNKNKITVIRSGIDTKKFKPGKTKKFPDFTIFSVGRAVEKKGFEYLVEAMQLLKQRNVDAGAVIVTSGPLRDRIKAMIDEKGLDNVKLLSNISDKELVDYYHKSHVFALPCVIASNGDMDGIPGVFFECMSAGLPVISTTVSGIPELISDHENGLLVKPRDSKALASAIETLYSDRKFLSRLSKETRPTILKRHNLTKQGEKWTTLFKKLV